MVSSAIWEKHARVSFSKVYKLARFEKLVAYQTLQITQLLTSLYSLYGSTTTTRTYNFGHIYSIVHVNILQYFNTNIIHTLIINYSTFT